MVGGAIGNDTLQVLSSVAMIPPVKGGYADHSLADEPIGRRHGESGELPGVREGQLRLVCPQAEERAQLVVDIADLLGEIKGARPGYQDFAHSAACKVECRATC